MPTNAPRPASVPAISLFSGAGGLDLGLEDAGGSVRLMVEPDRDSTATVRANRRFFRDAAILEQPIQKLSVEEILHAAGLRRGEAGLLVGGPPCQPFSKSGYWLQDRRAGLADARASLLDDYLRVLSGAHPEAFILENVASLYHPAHRETFERFLARARRAGYAVAWKRLNAVEYGVPQTRYRVFVLGLRGRHAPSLPEPTHWWGQPPLNSAHLLPPETAGRWISAFGSREYAEVEESLLGKWKDILREIPPGWNYKYLTSWAGCAKPLFIAESKYWSFLLKLSPYRPSWTIQASPGPWTGPLHWKSRKLRIPELAALQTFPPTFAFTGSRASRVRQIGNAVPPLLASRVAQALLADVCGTPPRRGRRLRYHLADGYEVDRSHVPGGNGRW